MTPLNVAMEPAACAYVAVLTVMVRNEPPTASFERPTVPVNVRSDGTVLKLEFRMMSPENWMLLAIWRPAEKP